MARAKTKVQLIEFSEKELKSLFEFLKKIEEHQLQNRYVFDNRTPKDIIAHLVAWHKMMKRWYSDGMDGKEVVIPAPGYSFKDTPQLNEKLYDDYKDVEWSQIIMELKKTSTEMINLINRHSEKELFEKKRYKWTGSTSMGSYFASATSSHYAWANKLLKRFIK